MSTLTIDLQEGFAGDTVAIRANRAEVYRRTGVSTNLAISLADSIELELPEGEVDLEIEVPTRGAAHSLRIALTGHLFLTVSLVEGRIETSTSTERPLYL